MDERWVFLQSDSVHDQQQPWTSLPAETATKLHLLAAKSQKLNCCKPIVSPPFNKQSTPSKCGEIVGPGIQERRFFCKEVGATLLIFSEN